VPAIPCNATMSRSRADAERMATARDNPLSGAPVDQDMKDGDPASTVKSIRRVTLYDAVAGRAGPNGFLSPEQRQSDTVLPQAPEAVLLSRSAIPLDWMSEAYNASEELPRATTLPESEMLKAIHTYAADFYSADAEEGRYDCRSLDETALIAVGILLEEAVKEALGENGDMVLVEPEGLSTRLEETNLTRYQIQGRVKPSRPPQLDSEDDSLEVEESPAKRQRR
jgi:hypothetical protein